jgi:alpha-tubulin suppressor-like RCC1 family protein
LVEGAGSENNPGTSTFVAEHVADDDLVAQVTAGHTFSLFLTDSGQAFAAGSSESGQLGNGKTGERLLKGGKTGFDLEVPARGCKRFRVEGNPETP